MKTTLQIQKLGDIPTHAADEIPDQFRSSVDYKAGDRFLSRLRLVAALTLPAPFAFVQNPGISRPVVQRQDISVPGRDAVVARVGIAPGTSAGRHTHAGEEISYVKEGELEVLVDGRPPLIVKTGESFIVPAGAKHDGRQIFPACLE